IVQKSEAMKILPPAITIIGDVVSMRDTFKWFENQPLSGKKVLVTRDEKQALEFSEKLRIKGATVRELPFIKIEEASNFVESELKNYSALLFNSSNGVKYFMENIKDLRSLGHFKIGVVGAKTDELLREYRIIRDFMPQKYMGSELAKEVVNFTKENDKVLFVTSDISPAECEKWSLDYKREFQKLSVYKTRKSLQPKEEVIKTLSEIDYITFLSSSTVESFHESVDGDCSVLKDKKIVSIGPVTTKTLVQLGYNVELEAKVFDVDGVIDAIGDDGNV
ncbi:MAG: uroporphyrinogen-III synthase, partial [Cetobacterium sp.]